MNAQVLYVKKYNGLEKFDYHTEFVDGTWKFVESRVFYCEKCKLTYSSFEKANQCCQNYICKCEKTCERKHYLICDKCDRRQKTEREKEKFNKATKLDIKDYTGYLLSGEYASDDYGMFFDDYFENTCEFACPECSEETEVKNYSNIKEYSHLHCKNSDCKWESQSFEIIDEIYYLFAPEYIWATDFKPLKLDLGNILEWATEEHHETVNDYMKGVEELRIAIDKFNELNKSIGSYNLSNSVALVGIKDFVKELYNK